MSRAMENYRAALSACPPSGAGVHAWMLGTANHAAAAGVDVAQAVAEITAAASRPPSPAGEVRDTVARAYREAGARVGMGLGTLPPPPRRPKPQPLPKTAAAFIRKGARVTGEDFLRASPIRPRQGKDGWFDAISLFWAVFRPGEFVFCAEDQRTPGILGETVRERDAWAVEFRRRAEAGKPLPLFFMPNPVSPVPAPKKDGNLSLRCDASIVAFRHAVAEMDGMPLAEQFSFWWGWGLDAVTAVTFSGSKSLHVLLRVDAADAEAWARDVKGNLFEKWLVPFGCDRACANPGRLSRLAGAVRVSGNRDKPPTSQNLWFVRNVLA